MLMRFEKYKIEWYRALTCVTTIFALFLSMGCAEVPVTHRSALHLVPDSELLSLSLQQYQDVLKKAKLSTDPAKIQMVRTVGERVAKAAESYLREAGQGYRIAGYHWEFNLLEDDKVVNAWAMPGGKVAVYTGILPFTQDEAGLAVVLGHEIAHAVAGHGNERMSQGLLAQMGGMALSVALAQQPAQTQALFEQAFGMGANIGFLLPYSRLQESEADRIGLIFMAKAGYDPRLAIPFWERMNAQGGQRPPAFLSTHPTPTSRIENLKRLIPEALPFYEKASAAAPAK
jgi:predicted Zn-dependent protease